MLNIVQICQHFGARQGPLENHNGAGLYVMRVCVSLDRESITVHLYKVDCIFTYERRIADAMLHCFQSITERA